MGKSGTEVKSKTNACAVTCVTMTCGTVQVRNARRNVGVGNGEYSAHEPEARFFDASPCVRHSEVTRNH
jgi:hypothetical protein